MHLPGRLSLPLRHHLYPGYLAFTPPVNLELLRPERLRPEIQLLPSGPSLVHLKAFPWPGGCSYARPISVVGKYRFIRKVPGCL